MAIIPRIMYDFYIYFLLPTLLLVLVGKPRPVITLIHLIMNIKEPIKGIKLFMFLWFACGLYAALNLLQKFNIENSLLKLEKSVKNVELYDTKMRELNLCERNAYMYLNFFVIIIIIERLCDSYFKLWEEDDKKLINE
jgi:hypothetical protein